MVVGEEEGGWKGWQCCICGVCTHRGENESERTAEAATARSDCRPTHPKSYLRIRGISLQRSRHLTLHTTSLSTIVHSLNTLTITRVGSEGCLEAFHASFSGVEHPLLQDNSPGDHLAFRLRWPEQGQRSSNFSKRLSHFAFLAFQLCGLCTTALMDSAFL